MVEGGRLIMKKVMITIINTLELTVAESPSAATTSISPGLSLWTINTTYIQHIPYAPKSTHLSLFHQLSQFSLVELANFKSS